LRRAITAYLINGRAEDQLLAISEPRSGQGLLIAAQAFASGRRIFRVGDVGNVAVADGDGCSTRRSGTRGTVADNKITIEVGQGAIEQHDRKAAAEQWKTLWRDFVACRCQQ